MKRFAAVLLLSIAAVGCKTPADNYHSAGAWNRPGMQQGVVYSDQHGGAQGVTAGQAGAMMSGKQQDNSQMQLPPSNNGAIMESADSTGPNIYGR